MRIDTGKPLPPLRNGNIEVKDRPVTPKPEEKVMVNSTFGVSNIRPVTEVIMPKKTCYVGKKECDYFIKSTSADSFDMCGACSVSNQPLYHWDRCPYDDCDAEALWSEWYRVVELKKTTTNPDAKQVLMDVLKAGFVLKRKV